MFSDENDDLTDITPEVEALDEETKFRCFKKAIEKLGLDEDEVEEGNPELESAFAEELKIAAVEVIFGELYRDGFIEATSVDDNGEICYKLTDEGLKYCEEKFGKYE